MSGPSSQTNSTQSVPAWLQPYLQGNLANAQGVEQTGNFSGTVAPVAPLSSLQQQGLSSLGSVNPTSIGAANTALTGLEGGQYLAPGQSQMSAATPSISSEASGSLMSPNSNPYLNQTFQQAADASQNQIASEFAGSGRNVTGSLPVQTDAMSTLANSIYGGQYDTNLAATQNAQNLASGNYNSGVSALNSGAAAAPGVTSGMLAPGQAQLAAGQTQQTQAQNVLNAPYNTLSWYSSLLGQGASPFVSTVGTSSTNPGTLGTVAGVTGDLAQIV